MPDFVVNGQSVTIDDADKIGEGGQGVVYRYGDYALKSLHPSFRQKWYMEKIAVLSRADWHPDIIRPISTVQEKSGASCGYIARLLPRDQYDGLAWYFDESYRAKYGVTVQQVADVFVDLLMLMHYWHQQGVAFGDFNEGAVMVLHPTYWDKLNRAESKYSFVLDGRTVHLPKELRVSMVDVDSVQYKGYPCDVYNLNTFDYRLNSRLPRLGADCIYDKEADIFAYGALLFETLTGVNVYSGYHPYYDSQKIMMENGRTVLHDDVVYPDHAMPVEKLPSSFQTYFKSLFTSASYRKPVQLDMLSDLGAVANAVYKRQSRPAHRSHKVSRYETLLYGLHYIEDVMVTPLGLNVLELTPEQTYVVHQIDEYGSRKIFLADSSAFRVSLNDHPEYVATAVTRTESYMLSVDGDSVLIPSPSHGINTAHSGISGGYVYAPDNRYINVFSVNAFRNGERMMRQAVMHAGNTDFYALGNGYAYTVTRMSTWEAYTLVTPKFTFNLDVQQRDLGQPMRENGFALSVSDKYAYMTRQVLTQGKPQTLVDWIDWSNEYQVKTTSSVIDGHGLSAKQIANAGNVILYPSRDGIVRESIDGKRDVFANTQSVVTPNSRLALYRRGLLVINSHDVAVIEL